MARAKQTDRAEARRRYRQTETQPDEAGDELDYGERRPAAAGRPASQPARNDARTDTPRPGFTSALRGAYHRANLREDLLALPSLLRSRAFLGAVGLILVGTAGVVAFPNYTGSRVALELLIWPGSALAPQLVAGFFAPRASYLLGFLVGLLQGIVFTILLTQLTTSLGTTLPADQMSSLLSLSFVTGPLAGALFAAAAAWYRRFLALSSVRRQASGRSQSRRPASR